MASGGSGPSNGSLNPDSLQWSSPKKSAIRKPETPYKCTDGTTNSKKSDVQALASVLKPGLKVKDAPKFELYLRELALDVLIDSVAHQTGLQNIAHWQTVHYETDTMYREKKAMAIYLAKDPFVHMGHESVIYFLFHAIRIYDITSRDSKEISEIYQKKLTDYLAIGIIGPRIKKNEWKVITTVFFVVRELALMIEKSKHTPELKLGLYSATIDACHQAMKRFNCGGLSEWNTFTLSATGKLVVDASKVPSGEENMTREQLEEYKILNECAQTLPDSVIANETSTRYSTLAKARYDEKTVAANVIANLY